MKLFATLTCIVLCYIAYSQTDTSYHYLNATFNSTDQQSAVYLSKTFQQLDKWKKHVFYINTGKLQMDASYSDAKLSKPCSTWLWYNEKGTLVEERIYDNEKLKDHYLYYDNSNIRMHAKFKNGELKTAEGWDSTGNKISNFIYLQRATFPGNLPAWTKYLTKAIDTNAPERFKKGLISGVIQVAFTVDKDGNITETYIKRSSGYTELDAHALEIIRNAPKWKPAIQYNEKVKFMQVQAITYKLAD